jgi:hypothetical protein
MKRAPDGSPVVEPGARGLGVRVPPGEKADVDLDAGGKVVMNGRGMSVASHWRRLPTHRIPERLDDGILGANGPNADRCWRLGDGAFEAGHVTDQLSLALKGHDPQRGNVVPTSHASLASFQANLAATRPAWEIDES